ncbi:MAG TPA: DUF2357 domain-containing protein [Bacilli bacterium]|nr:DUF2357 domain-containing protein [Bacilli bacterium]
MMEFNLGLRELKKGSSHAWRLHPEGQVDEVVLVEYGKYRITFEGDVQPALNMLDARVNPTSVKETEKMDGQIKYQITWELELKDYAGETVLSLWQDEEILWCCSFLIKPMVGKLSQEAYLTMLEQLSEPLTSMLQGLGNVQIKWEDGEMEASLVASLVAIKMYGKEVVQAFRRILMEKQRELISDSDHVPWNKVKQASSTTLHRVVTNPKFQSLRKGRGQHSNLLIPSQVRKETHNTPTNRYLKELLVLMQKHGVEVIEHIQFALGKEKQAFAKERLRYFLHLVSQFRADLDSLTKLPFMKEMEAAPLSHSSLQSFTNHPAYARFFRISKAILHPQLKLSPRRGDMGLPTIPSWHIYEYWVFFQLLKLIESSIPDLHWKLVGKWEERGVVREWDDQYFYSFTMDGHSMKTGLHIKIAYQEKFPSYHSTRDLPEKRRVSDEDFRSISGTMIPDLFVRVKRGDQTKGIVLDAKYRTSEYGIKESLDAVHKYKNGLRNGVMETCGVFIIVPACEERVESYFRSQYRTDYQFGGFRLHPVEKDDRDELRDWLKRWLEEWEEVSS